MRKRFLLLACAFMAFSGVRAQDPAALQQQMMQQLPTDPGTKVGTLPNGLTYYIRHNERPQGQANFYIAQKVGSVLEEDNQRGLAHFLEHMCFNGTENFPGNSLISYLETIGVKFGEQLNAYTSIDETVYNINNVPTGRVATIDSVLLILHDWSHNLTLDPQEIDKERGVIHEEWRMRSSATMRIYERQMPRLMSNSRPGNRLPIGTMEVVDNFKPEALRAYYEKWYRPDQQAIIVVGDLDVNHVEEQIRKIFSPIQMPANAAKREYFSVPDNAEPIIASDKDKEQAMPVVLVMNKHEQPIPHEMKNTMPGMVTNMIISMAQTMLNQRLNEMTEKPETPFLGAAVEDGNFLLASRSSAFTSQIVPKDGQLSQAIQSVMAEVYRAARFGFTASEFGRCRAEILSQIESAYTNRDKREHGSYINECVQHFLNNEPMPGIETEYQLYNALLPQLTVDQVNSVFAQLVSQNDSNLVVLSMNPDREGYAQPTEQQLLSAIHAAQQMELAAYVDNVKNEPLIPQLPTPGTIVKEKAGKFGFTELTLSNGVRVFMRKTDFKDNEILMSAYSPGGTGRYPVQDKYTLSTMNAYLGSSGLGNFTSTELGKALAGVQASCSPSLTELSEGLSGSAVPKDVRTMFELAYLHFQPLHRDDQAVSSRMAQLHQQLSTRHSNPMTALQDSIQTTLYGPNPYLVILEAEDLQKSSYDRALEIYSERFADASDFIFYFIGNIDEDSIRALSCQYLASLPTVKRNDKPVENGLRPRKGLHVNRFQQKQEQPQCYALVYAFTPTKYNLRQSLVADMLGQALEMRYLETIREEMGAAYSVQATGGLGRASLREYQASVQVVLPVKPEMCDTSLQVVDEVLQDVARNGVEDKYLTKIKEYMLKDVTESERQNGAWLNRIHSFVKDGHDTYTGLAENIQSITGKDLAKMAAQILKAKNRTTVVMMPQQ